jgi:hypothetical protein
MNDPATSPIVPKLPDYFSAERGDPVPDNLVGARILRFGTFEQSSVEGRGLVIDYRPDGGTATHRAVFAFNELGMWVAWTGPLETIPILDALR